MSAPEYGQSWLKSKVGKFMAIYIGLVVALTHAVEWIDEHAWAINIALVLIVLTVVMTWLYRLFRRW